MSVDSKSDIYAALTGLAIGFVVVVLVMGVEFIHVLTRTSQLGAFN